jgi:hypothetical protein
MFLIGIPLWSFFLTQWVAGSKLARLLCSFLQGPACVYSGFGCETDVDITHSCAADDFPRKKERSDGLDSYCKACNCELTAMRLSRKTTGTQAVAARKVWAPSLPSAALFPCDDLIQASILHRQQVPNLSA